MLSTAAAMALQVDRLGFWGAHEVRLGRGKDAHKRRHGISFWKAHSSDSQPTAAASGISRRESLAFGIFIAQSGLAGSFMTVERVKADEVEKSAITLKSNESSDGEKYADEDRAPKSPFNSLVSLFDSNEKTKSGKLLPKSYLKSARNVVKSLKESLNAESSKETDVRKSADLAKVAIRDYMLNWRGQKAVESEDSYKALEGVFKILGNFYAKRGPRAVLPSDVKSEIMRNLEVADAGL